MRRCLVILGLSLIAAMPGWAQQADLRDPKSAIPFKQEPDLGDQLWRIALMLAGVGALLAGGVFVYKRYSHRLPVSRSRRLRLLESMRLSPKSALFLIQFDDQTVLVGQQGDSLSVLATRPVASEDLPRQ